MEIIEEAEVRKMVRRECKEFGSLRAYAEHLYRNWVVALRCVALAIFHAVHGVLPLRITEHERWGL